MCYRFDAGPGKSGHRLPLAAPRDPNRPSRDTTTHCMPYALQRRSGCLSMAPSYTSASARAAPLFARRPRRSWSRCASCAGG